MCDLEAAPANPNRAKLNHALDSQVPTSSSMSSPLTLSSSSTLRLHPPWFQIFSVPDTRDDHTDPPPCCPPLHVASSTAASSIPTLFAFRSCCCYSTSSSSSSSSLLGLPLLPWLPQSLLRPWESCPSPPPLLTYILSLSLSLSLSPSSSSSSLVFRSATSTLSFLLLLPTPNELFAFLRFF